MHRVRMLKYHGIKPYIVFDGGDLPAKLGTEDDRAQSVQSPGRLPLGPPERQLTLCPLRLRRRAENLAKAMALNDQGRAKEARELYTKCIDVTPELALQFIKVSPITQT